MHRQLFILVPSLTPSGPIKGAIALCEALKEDFAISLVPLKAKENEIAPSHPSIKVIHLGACAGWIQKIRAYRSLLVAANVNELPLSLSLCFSADIINFITRKRSIAISSIRGHLPKTYRHDYGILGFFLVIFHFYILNKLDLVIAMTETMARQFHSFTGTTPITIGNFIDEADLEQLRIKKKTLTSHSYRFLFIGRLDQIKCPTDLIYAVAELHREGFHCTLDIFGQGPLENFLKVLSKRLAMSEYVRFRGFSNQPWTDAATADCLVLPSKTEGISRAVLEALFLGIPCVLRNIDSNADLIIPRENGELFEKLEELPEVMKRCALLGRELSIERPILTPDRFRKEVCISQLKSLLETLTK